MVGILPSGAWAERVNCRTHAVAALLVPAKAANPKVAEEFFALATSPKVQADGIVKRFNWYPGIDAAAVKAQLDEATWQKLFVDVTPEDLATKGKPFPIAPYFNDILESYERKVQ